MDTNRFSLEEIRKELARLGYNGLSKQTLLKFQNDLDELADKDRNQPRKTQEKPNFDQRQSNVDFTIQQPSQSDDEFNRPDTDDDNEQSLDETNTPSLSTFYPRPRAVRNDDDNQSVASSQRVIKRKVLRHHNGRARVYEESRSEASSVLDSRDVSYLNEPSDQHVRGRRRIESASDIGGSSVYSDDNRSVFSVNPVKSFIRPSTSSTSSLRRSRSFSSNHVDSVQLYSYYQQQWSMQRAPGEKSHKALRWAVRDQLLQKDVPARRRSAPRVNNYVVPTSKKRSALRWNVRYSLANGIRPSKTFDDFSFIN